MEFLIVPKMIYSTLAKVVVLIYIILCMYCIPTTSSNGIYDVLLDQVNDSIMCDFIAKHGVKPQPTRTQYDYKYTYWIRICILTDICFNTQPNFLAHL